MARGLNKVMIIGNLGADPEMRFTPSGSPVTNFRVAVNRVRRGPDGNNIEETEWFRVVAWDKLAEIANEYLRKGRSVYVEGRLQSRKYTGNDGVERTSVEVVATDMQMLGGRGEGEMEMGAAAGGAASSGEPSGGGSSGGGNRAPQRAVRQSGNNDYDDGDIDDVPFD